MTPEQELLNLIEKYVSDSCDSNMPNICRLKATDEGYETVVNMVYQYCIHNGVSVQSALAHIESELT